MNKSRLWLATALLMTTVLFEGCKPGNKQNQLQTETALVNILQVDDVLKQAAALAGDTIEAEGICTHICAHGGGKIFLMGSDDKQTIRIEAGKEFGKFKPETVNNIVRVKGTLVEERIDETYLAQWEERLKAQTEEKHGKGEAGCSSEQKARGENTSNTQEERIANFRKRITERQAQEGKAYLSFYHINATEYSIQE